MTKKQIAIARQNAWKQALVEGRVLRLMDGSLKAYPSVEDRDAAVNQYVAAEVEVEIVQASLEEQKQANAAA